MTDKYPRVSQTQVDLWLMDPVTQAYKVCLNTAIVKADKDLASGDNIDITNNDASMNRIHLKVGGKEALRIMSDFENILTISSMIEVPKDEGKEV